MTILLTFLVLLNWNRNPSPDVAGYRVYWRTFDITQPPDLGGPFFVSWDVGNTNRAELATVPNVGFDYAVTCYDRWGNESDFSNENFCIYVRP